MRSSPKYRLATQGVVIMGRLSGVSIPWRERVISEQAGILARWAAEALGRLGHDQGVLCYNERRYAPAHPATKSHKTI